MLLVISLTIVCFTSVGLSSCYVLKSVNNRILSVVCSVFFCRMCLSWTRRASVSDQKSTRMISLLQIHLFHSPHPSHMLSSQPQKHFPLSLSSPLLNVNSEHFFLAWEHSVISFFVALFSELLPSHSFPSDFLRSSVFFNKAASSLCGLEYMLKKTKIKYKIWSF